MLFAIEVANTKGMNIDDHFNQAVDRAPRMAVVKVTWCIFAPAFEHGTHKKGKRTTSRRSLSKHLPFIFLCGRLRIRTADPLLVRQML